MVSNSLLTTEQEEFLRQNVKGKTSAQLTTLINDKFDLSLTVKQINSFKKNKHVASGVSTRFQKGNVPYNKGIKEPWKKDCNCAKTFFRKGNIPANHKAVGSERINIYGYIEIKVADPRKWCPKHRVVWEQRNGLIPKGYVIIFADKNKLNCHIDNLLLVSRSELLRLNRENLIFKNAKLTKVGINIAKVLSKTAELKKRTRG